ncbi:MAG: hypothetical protein OHK0022_29560 [Roseiflexaceae bacterium]
MGIGLRIGWLLLEPHQIVFDEQVYHGLAARLAAGEPFGLEIWPPGWPMVLGLAYRLFGAQPTVGMALNLLASLAVMLLVWRLAAHMLGPRGGLVALWLAALMPSFVVLNVVLGYEVWLQLLLALACWLVAARGWRWSTVLALAAITALAALVRPFWLALPLLLSLCIRPAGPGSRPAPLALALLGALALLLPWLVHVSLLAGRPVPVAPNGGMNLWIGNNPNATGTFMRIPASLEGPQADPLATREALAYIRAEPLRAVALLPRKLWYLLSIEGYSATRYPLVNHPEARVPNWLAANLGTLMNGSYWLLSLAALAGAIRLALRRRWHLFGPLLIFGFNLLCYLPFFGFSRYRWPAQFILIIYAAFLMDEEF